MTGRVTTQQIPTPAEVEDPHDHVDFKLYDVNQINCLGFVSTTLNFKSLITEQFTMTQTLKLKPECIAHRVAKVNNELWVPIQTENVSIQVFSVVGKLMLEF